VYLGVCSVLFALYVKLRTAIDHDFRFRVFRTTHKYIDDYNEHIHECHCEGKDHDGENAVTKAFQIHRTRLESMKYI